MAPDIYVHFMRYALNLARRGLGRTAPNPSVGCVIVKEGVVIGCGWTGDSGRPHAETQALAQAGAQSQGTTAYVSFEPCAHEGETPSCAKALVAAGIRRVVVACADPDPRVSGQGIQILKEAGIEIVSGVLEEEAQSLNRGFILRITQDRPLVTLKTAISKDGKIAAAPGKQTRITGDLAHRRVHLERSRHDAVLVGIETVLADDPSLTTRIEEYGHNLIRIVLDTNLQIPPDSKLVKGAATHPLWILHNSKEGERGTVLEEKGVKLFQADTRDLKQVLALLAQEGVTRLLVEGGAKIHTSFLEAGLCDRMLCFKAPAEIGPGGVDALIDHEISNIEVDFSLKKQKTMAFEQDLLEIYGNCA